MSRTLWNIVRIRAPAPQNATNCRRRVKVTFTTWVVWSFLLSHFWRFLLNPKWSFQLGANTVTPVSGFTDGFNDVVQ